MRRILIMSRAAELLFCFVGPDSYRDTLVLYFYIRLLKFHTERSRSMVCRTSEILFFFLLKTKKEQNCVHNDVEYC